MAREPYHPTTYRAHYEQNLERVYTMKSGESLFSLATAFLILAGVALVVKSPNASKVITSAGNVFIGSVKAATQG